MPPLGPPTTRGFFGSAFFSNGFFGSDFWKERVPVPVPTPVPTGGGGGIWPIERVERCNTRRRKYDKAIKNLSKIIREGGDSPKTKKAEKDLVSKLRSEIYDLKDKANSMSKELKERREKDKLYQERDAYLHEQIRCLCEEIANLKKEIWKLEQKMRPKITLSELARRADENTTAAEAEKKSVVAVAPPPAPVPTTVAALPEEVSIGTRVGRALPWALASTLATLGTWHLVPKKMRFVKFCGYGSAASLGYMAVSRFFDS
jgi:hypothetical protein